MKLNRRNFIYTVTSSLAACATRSVESNSFDAVVATDASRYHRAPVFPSLQAALDAAPTHATTPHRILIGKGYWREKLIVTKPFIHLLGEDRHTSVLSFDAFAGQASPDGKPWGTSRSATLIVRAPDFSARNLTIENAFDYLAYIEKAKAEHVGANGPQAVALMLDEGSDRSFINRCDITGYQDTLFANAGRSLFRDCRVTGAVDFIFGAGRAVFEQCEIESRYRPGSARQGIVAAPSTSITQEQGFVFMRSRLTKEKSVPANTVALGRAWRPTRTFPDGRYGDPNAIGSAVYLNCWMDDHIAIEGWDAMEYGARDGTRVAFQPKDARFFEHGSRGPGAHVNAQRRVLSAVEVQRYYIRNLLADWKP